MKKYLSSYKIWNKSEDLIRLFWKNKKIALIFNARDIDSIKSEKIINSENIFLNDLKSIWLIPEILDLKEYFWKENELDNKLKNFSWVFVTWWNVFVLAQAFKLSWFWKIIKRYNKEKINFTYAGYSAWCCILSPTLYWYHIVDNPNIFPYKENKKELWDWLWLIEFNFSPHYDSNHPESKLIYEEIQYCIENKILFKAVRDWEVLVFE